VSTKPALVSSVHPAERIKRLHLSIREIRSDWLTRSGWEQSVNTPGRRPMWVKKWHGKLLLATTAIAATLQSAIDNDGAGNE
jgi:hypothetical protein